ncbi:MAG: monovalent cation/H+ antiporter subunit D family protein [Clostridiales bacterium]|nr:monovalent cation/H+ antiporter subunit D family protein [Candidatus Crickella equi]
MNNFPALIVVCPLCAALLNLVLNRINEKLGKAVIVLSVAASLIMSVFVLAQVITTGTIHYHMGNYDMPLGIEFVIDTVNGLIVVLVSLIGFLTLLFSDNFGYKFKTRLTKGAANTVLTLLIVGLLGMTLTGDVFNLYVFLEITSLSAYCLIALGGERGIFSAFRYLLVGTVAATFYLLGVAILYGVTGTLNMADMADILNEGGKDQAMLLAICFLVPAFGIKMALFPFHGWQPSAYSYSEAGAAPLITGVMGKIPAYAMFRYLYCIYGTDFKYFNSILVIVGVFSVFGMLYGSIRAIAQTDIRKILAYSSVAQIGYISLGFAIGTPIALCGAFLHMLGHAFMKGGLFFCTGAIRHKFGTVNIEDFGRIYKKMPLTCGTLTIAALSMVGIPPTVGFFSKWYLGSAAAMQGEWIYLAVLVISSLLNAIYFFRLIEKVFINEDKSLKERVYDEFKTCGWKLVLPVVVCFIAILGLGLANVKIIDILMLSLKGVGLC